jgi:hypothetical protein
MRYTYIIILILCGGISQAQKVHREEAFLKGNVKSTETVKHYAIEKEGVYVKISTPIYENEPDSSFTLYNKLGNRIHAFSQIENGKLLYNYKYEYDEKNREKEKIHIDSAGTNKYSHLSFYNNDGHLEKIVVVNRYVVIQETIKYKYDTMGFLVEELQTFGTFLSGYRKVFTNNEKGLCIKFEFFDKDKKLKYWNVMSYNSSGNIDEVKRYKNGEYLSRIKYTYKNDWVSSETIYDKNEKIEFKEENEYNEEGLLQKRKVFYTDPIRNSESTYKYKYDEQGNWILVIQYLNGKVFLLTERVIEYEVE